MTPKSLYYDFLLTKEEETEVYKNFHESGEVYFMRNGEKLLLTKWMTILNGMVMKNHLQILTLGGIHS